ncbi:glycosyltransferase family 2 protein [Asaia lannensis]|uniref:glycosyltransferase family 2 protein n=1 Tax=Asaia lannensis TaxID=415421 RepID=UPI0038738684
MMQRDEGAMLMAWLSYYGRLFGFEHLTVFDNGSCDPLTLHLLAQAERCGVTVRRDRRDMDDFHAKGLHFAEQIRAWDREGGYDFALPVDCDEFIAVVDDNGLSTSASRIMGEFDRLRGERRALRIGSSLFNLPSRPGWFAVDTDFIKGFLPARSIATMDNGHHNPTSSLASGFALSRFTYLHWHNRDFAQMQQRARLKLSSPLLDPDDRTSLLRYASTPNLPGRHLVDLLLEDEAHYLTRYDGMLQAYMPWAASPSAVPIHVENGPVLLRDARGAKPWSSADYPGAQGDIEPWPLGPLLHYFLHGWAEGRRF